MSFNPKFMRSFKTFDRESWPEKPADPLGREVAERPQAIAKIRDGRRWAPSFWTIDLSPEARYQYFWTLRAIGAPLEDPASFGLRRTPGSRWQQECGFCGIATSDDGDLACPPCGRELYWEFVAD